MSVQLNETHNPALRSWVVSANDGNTDFPIQNLAFGVFRRAGTNEQFRIGVAIGDQILDLNVALHAGVFAEIGNAALAHALTASNLNALMDLGNAVSSQVRLALSKALRENAAAQKQLVGTLVAQADAEYALPE